MLVLVRPDRMNWGHRQTKHTEIRGVGQAQQTKKWVLARRNRPKIAIGQTEGATQFFSRPLGAVAPDPPPPPCSRTWNVDASHKTAMVTILIFFNQNFNIEYAYTFSLKLQ